MSARLAVVALREEREIAEAHASAKRQAMLYEGTEVRLRQLAGPQPHAMVEGARGSSSGEDVESGFEVPEELQQFLFPGWQDFAEPTLAGMDQSDAPGRFAGVSTEFYGALDDLDDERSWDDAEYSGVVIFRRDGGAGGDRADEYRGAARRTLLRVIRCSIRDSRLLHGGSR